MFPPTATMVNIPKERKTYCKSKKCSKHSMHKVSFRKTLKYIHSELATAAL